MSYARGHLGFCKNLRDGFVLAHASVHGTEASARAMAHAAATTQGCDIRHRPKGSWRIRVGSREVRFAGAHVTVWLALVLLKEEVQSS